MAPIIIIRDKTTGKVTKFTVSGIEKEELLQKLIETSPEVLPIPYSEKLVSLKIEYPLKTGGWIDILCTDSEGKVYVIETKLQKNTDKRKALAQLIEYTSQLAKENFTDFKRKVDLENTIKKRFGPNVNEEKINEITSNMERAFSEKNFTLVLVMDEFDEPLETMITFLRSHYEMDLFGVKLQRYNLDERNEEEFIADVVGIDVPPPPPSIQSSPKDFKKSYSEKGLGSEADIILKAFTEIESSSTNKHFTKNYLYLTMNTKVKKRAIEIFFNIEPERDSGVWVNDSQLYEEVFNVGNELGLDAKKPSTENGKVILFNGTEGVRKVAPHLKSLAVKLAEICQKRS
jgi:hypothetical protein